MFRNQSCSTRSKQASSTNYLGCLSALVVTFTFLVNIFPYSALAEGIDYQVYIDSGAISPEESFQIPGDGIQLGCCGGGPMCDPNCSGCPGIIEQVGGLPCPEICYNGPSAPVPKCEELCQAIIAAMMAVCQASIGQPSFGYGDLTIGCSGGEKITGCEPIHTPCYPVMCQDCFACVATGVCGVHVTCGPDEDVPATPTPTPSPSPTSPIIETPPPGPTGEPTVIVIQTAIPTPVPIFLRE